MVMLRPELLAVTLFGVSESVTLTVTATGLPEFEVGVPESAPDELTESQEGPLTRAHV
jgi:hypothetical protein